MKSRYIVIFIIFLQCYRAFGKPPEIVYEGTLIASGFKQNIPLASDGPFPIGFTFSFFETPYTQFYVSANGLVMFTDPDGFYSTEVTIPTGPATPNNFIAPFWDNLSIVDGGNILYRTVGASPNRKCIIQFKNMGFDPVPTPLGTFTVILYETSNVIQVQYRLIVDNYSPMSHGESATIGLENSTGASGVLYAFHNPDSVHTEHTMSFSPLGSTYTINTNALYDGVFLTANGALPDPGIVNLVSPPEDAVIGTSHTFEWSAASNASSYILVIDTLSSLATATPYYYPGLNLTYDISTLLLNKTYYWAVFSANATAITWCEIKRFTTALIPPLVPVPQTIWAEQPKDKTIKLQYTGGDASPKKAIITSIPAQGQLYQYNAGVRGSPISLSSLPDTVTDAAMNVIYAATGSSGNAVGNFNFKLRDADGVSPEGTITINVSPPGVPNVLYVAKNANVEIQLDLPMANPSGKQNQFTVKTPGIVTIDSATLKKGDPYTIVLHLHTPLAGTETVTVSYTQDPVTPVTSAPGGVLVTFTDQLVTLTAQTIYFPQSFSLKFNDSPLFLTATASSGLGLTYTGSNLSVATVEGSILTFHAVGTSDITARQAGNVAYAPAKYTKTLSVAKGDQTISFAALTTRTYGDPDFNLAATATSNLSVSFSSGNTSVATIAGTLLHITGAGTSVITASQSGNTLWNPAPDVLRTLTVNKATATVTLGSLTATYDGLAHAATATTNPAGLTVGFTYDGAATVPVNAGSYAVVGTINDINYQGTVSGTLTINKATLTATADDKTRVYGDPNPALTVSYSGFVNSETTSVLDVQPVASTIAGPATNVGTVPITVSGGTDNNYSFTYLSGTLTITKATATVTLGSLTATYDGLPHAATATTNPAGLTVGFTYDGSATVPVNAGSYAVVCTINDINYQGTVSGTLTINKATLTATADDKTRVYGDPNPALTVSYSGFVNSETTSVLDVQPVASTIAGPATNVGTVPITVSGGTDNNYSFTYVSGTLTITKATATVTLGSLTATYNGVVNAATATTNPAGLTVGFTYDGAATVPVNEGSYAVVGTINDINYQGTVSGTLTINKATLTATADDKTRVYGDPNPVLTVSYSGFVNSETASVLDVQPVASTIAGPATNVGTVPITVSGGTDNNYSFTYLSGTLTITKATATVTLGSLTATYDGLAHAATTTTNPAGLTVGLTYDGAATIPVNAGSYAVVGAINDINYQGTVSGTLTINKATLTFTAENKSRIYLVSNPALLYTISGFVNSETQLALDALPSIQTTALQSSPVGIYPITITGGNDHNYNYLYVPGTLTITKYSQTITFTGFPDRLLVEDVYTLIATSTSGLTVLFESMDITKATVTGDQLTGVSKGMVQIRAFHPGDMNYDAAEAFATVEIYSTHRDILHLFTPNNDGINDYWELPELATWGKCDVRVFSRSGKLVFADADYNNLWDGTSNGYHLPEGAYYFVIKTENAGMVKGTVNIVR